MLSISDYILTYQVRVEGTCFIGELSNLKQEFVFPYVIDPKYMFAYDLIASPSSSNELVSLLKIDGAKWTYGASGFNMLATFDGEPLPPTITDPRTGDVWTLSEAKVPTRKTWEIDAHKEEAYELYVYLRTQTRKYLYHIPLENLLYAFKVDFKSIEDFPTMGEWLEDSDFPYRDPAARALYRKIKDTKGAFIASFGDKMYQDLLEANFEDY